MHYYSFNIADYRKDTNGLQPEEHYIYRTLLDECYLTELPLNPDIRELMRDLRLTSDQKPALEYILNKYFELTDDGYINDKVNRVLSKAYAKSEKARASVQVRWDKYERKKNGYERNTNVEQTNSERNTNAILPNTHNPIPNNPKKKTATKRFVAPTLKQVKDYKQEKSLNLDPAQFIDFYESKGWLVGKTKMRDWKAAARGWSNRETKESGNGKLKLPRDDEQLQTFAKSNGLPCAVSGETFWQYRNRLSAEIEKRDNQ